MDPAELALNVLALFPDEPDSRDEAIALLESATEHLRSTDDRHGKVYDRAEASDRVDAHDCEVHPECTYGKGHCMFYIKTHVDFCEHCGDLPRGSIGYETTGVSWCLACGESDGEAHVDW
jgi:hypothetical protein